MCIEQSHIIDDIEKKRTSHVRAMKRSVSLLDDALNALRAGRTSVTDEYIERTLMDLLNELKGQTNA